VIEKQGFTACVEIHNAPPHNREVGENSDCLPTEGLIPTSLSVYVNLKMDSCVMQQGVGKMRKFLAAGLLLTLALMALAPVSAQGGAETLVLYSGRNEELIQPIIDQFVAETGVQVDVRYGNTAGLANQILEEGDATPADVYLGQDAGALGALANAGALAVLPSDVLDRVPDIFRDPAGQWVGLSGRARLVIYNPVLLEESGLELPASILDLTDPVYSGVVGWAPANASFQTNVTALRLLIGEDETAAWLSGMVDNGAVSFGSSNGNLHRAVISGEVILGVSNHYYLFNFLNEDPNAPIAHHYFPAGDPGSLLNVSGIGVLASSEQPGLAQRLVLYLLGNSAQQYFADSTYEYPVVDGIAVNELLVPLSEIEPPALNLSDLHDLQTTIELIEASGALD
jgi:iron(III) transport system substrate-binding protein